LKKQKGRPNISRTTIHNSKNNIDKDIMLSLTIYLALLCQNVETNPGPRTSKAPTLSVLTYNCNGDPKKLKRLLLKLNGMVDRGCNRFIYQKDSADSEVPGLKLIGELSHHLHVSVQLDLA
jgi:hypothetical protein